jgi:hypothetical protein
MHRSFTVVAGAWIRTLHDRTFSAADCLDATRLSGLAANAHSTVNRPSGRLTITRGGPTLRRWIQRGGILVIGVHLMQSAQTLFRTGADAAGYPLVVDGLGSIV